MTVIIPRGKYNDANKNNMYFAFGEPIITDNRGLALPWAKIRDSFGTLVTTYITADMVEVIGTWDAECSLKIETIHVVH